MSANQPPKPDEGNMHSHLEVNQLFDQGTKKRAKPSINNQLEEMTQELDDEMGLAGYVSS